MTAKELLDSVQRAISPLYGEREAASVAWIVAEETVGLTRTEALAAPFRELAVPDNWAEIIEDLASGRPVQYVLGKADFCGLQFAVDEGVLVPRPETEELVCWVASENMHSGRILDIGTGSGAIAIALAVRIPTAKVRATDISSDALRVASGNAAANGVKVEFLKADILADLSQWEGEWSAGMFDVVVSNPPYIPQSDMDSMRINVTRYEPHLALFVPDDDPLLFYMAIARRSKSLLRPGGGLYFEIYENLAAEMLDLLREEGFSDIELRQDINGRNRMVRCRKK